LADVPKLSDPYSPLDPREDAALREELAPIRGGDRLNPILRHIRRAGDVHTLHLLTGHFGTGKTTELRGLAHRLEVGEEGVSGLSVLFLDAEKMLDLGDVDLEDVLVGLWSEMFRRDAKIAADVLGPVWRDKVQQAFSSLVLDLPQEALDAVGRLLGDIKLGDPKRRVSLRAAIGSVARPLIDGLNNAFARIRKSDGVLETVIIIDNLEKMEPRRQEAIERLFLERLSALKDLDAHLVITVPLHLIYSSAGPDLVGRYGGEVVVLPMIKVRKRSAEGGGDAEPGIAALARLLSRRVDFASLFEGGDDAAREVARQSGGCIRHALRIVSAAANECDTPPVPRRVLARAMAVVRADYDRALQERWVPFLRLIAAENRFPEALTEVDKREMLRHLFVLEYQNDDPEPWYAVHPLVEQCAKYLRAP
jgi:hypothetical protein